MTTTSNKVILVEKLRPCPHCHTGELFIDHDSYGYYESCLQCGFSKDLPKTKMGNKHEYLAIRQLR